MLTENLDVCVAAILIAKEPSELALLEPTFQSTSTAKDPALVQRNIDAAKENWYATAAEHHLLNRISHVCFMCVRHPDVRDGDPAIANIAVATPETLVEVLQSMPTGLKVRWFGNGVKAIRKAVWHTLASQGSFSNDKLSGDHFYGCSDFELDSLLDVKPNQGTSRENSLKLLMGAEYRPDISSAESPEVRVLQEARYVCDVFVRAGAIPPYKVVALKPKRPQPPVASKPIMKAYDPC